MKLAVTIKKILKIAMIVIASFLMSFLSCEAATFKYSEFNWKKFLSDHPNYWITGCTTNEDGIENCDDEILKKQEKFYTRLYKILAKYEKKGLYIKDYIIIATAFYGFDPSEFNDNSGAYKYESDDINSFDVSEEKTADYYDSETDTLKLLTKAMINSEAVCYGKSSAIKHESTDEDGNVTTSYTCNSGALRNIDGTYSCLVKLDSRSIGFWDNFSTSIFGISRKDKASCDQMASNASFPGYYTETSKNQVSEDRYWEFLETGKYFDRKDNLQSYFRIVLNKVNKSKMGDLTPEEYEEYNDEIIASRRDIIDSIKSIIKPYDEAGSVVTLTNSNNTIYWWPVGSKETTTSNGVLFASGDPISTDISSMYGYRNDPKTGERRKHNGIDLTGSGGVGIDPVIAARAGTVVEVSNTCISYQDCSVSYGNYVKILHADGFTTIYAHLHENTITVKEGETVAQGQVIGMIGSSGYSTGAHLHFEVRTGSSSDTAVDPLNYINISNPRITSSSSSLVDFLIALEGGSNNNGSYKVICNAHDIPTVGHGITLLYNANYFAKHGYTLTTSNNYYNYCNTTMPADVVDAVFEDVLNSFVDNVKMAIADYGFNLTDYQIDALTSLKYNCGNINGFYDAYKSYGNSNSLCTNWWHNKAVDPVFPGLYTRRKKECSLFLTGVYDGTYT